jgi:spermidine/putrescine transport system permease protein
VGIREPNDPVPWLIYSQFTVILVLVYVWVPFVALPIFVTLESLDLQMLEASSDLGASRWTTFRKVTLPMSMPGVIAAFVFVFIPTIGEYVTPQIVGGKAGYLFGNVIQSSFSASFDWQLGSAMSMFLLVTVAILLAIFGRYLNVRTVAE